jgi:hypothetical protein
MPFGAFRIHYQLGGSPLRSEAGKSVRFFFYMKFDRDEVIGNELANPVVGINLGFQPGTSPSHRGGAEIQQNRFLSAFGLRKGGIGILLPIDCSHLYTSLCLQQYTHGAAVRWQGLKNRLRRFSARLNFRLSVAERFWQEQHYEEWHIVYGIE